MALDKLIPRYALWLHMADHDCDPEELGGKALLAFFDTHLDGFLAQKNLHLGGRKRSRLRRTLQRFSPDHATPYEVMERLSAIAT